MDWTPVLDWLASHGVRILIILIVGAALYFAVRKLVPRVVVHTVQRRMAKKIPEEIEIPWHHTKVYFGGPLPQGGIGEAPTPMAP